MATLQDVFTQAVDEAVEDRLEEAVAIRVAQLSMMGEANPRVLTLPEGDGPITLSDLLRHNQITVDWTSMQAGIQGEGGVKVATPETTLRGGETIFAGTVEPNG